MSLLRSPSGLLRHSPFKRSDEEEDQSDEIEETDEDDVFQIPPKRTPPESLHNWRQATLVLNASRRFRYTLDLKRQKEAQDRVNKLKASTQAILAVRRFQEASKGAVSDQPPPDGYGLHPTRLAHLIEARDVNELQALGGVGGLAKALHTNLEKGTDGDLEDIQKRKEAYGENRYSTTPPKGFLVFVWEAFQDTTLIILMVCAVLSIVLEMSTSNDRKSAWYDGASIGFAVILVVLVTALSDYKQALQFRGLSEEKRNIQLQVLRDGRRFPISIFEIVVGDVVPLNIGDQVPADGVFISGHSLQIDESSMTGESQPVHVDEKHPFLISGCKVVDGYATMLVTSVGMNTEWGQVMATLEDDTGEETPLQVRLNGAATFIGKVGLTVAALVFIMLIVRYFVDEFRHGDKRAKVVLKRLVQILSVAVTIVVVAVPEGLPLAVTLTLAYSMRKMMADKSLVRHLAACETMGSATTICSDKTGTLTMNQMVVTKTWVAGSFREPGAIKSECQRACEILIDGIAQNCSGSVFIPKGGGEPEVSGSPTEKAILQWGLEIGMDFENSRLVSTVLKVETFNSSKKRAGVMIKKANEIYVHWKGASEMVLELCSKWLDSKGDEIEITEEKLLELKGAIEEMATASLRCVALAYRRADNDEVPGEEGLIPEDRLVLLGIVGIKDPCRPGVRDAVAICQKAGVKVRMVTGDNGLTARAIAEECGILTPGGLVVEGPEFRNYGDEERKQQLPKIDVMARSSPMDKLLLVKTLKEMGEVVAVTGDGTNDAPALHEADIGLSMGISGTEVAKESSDIIILDDNFASVVKVVRWGRSVYANIQKFIQFQLTVNVVALVINFVAAAKSADVPLNAVQLLWVNLIMDTLGALALATEPPTDELMDKRPVGRRDPLITNVMWRNIMIQAAYQLAVELTLYLGGESILKLSGTAAERKTLLNTIIFNSFVFCQLFNEINARKPDKLNVFTGIFRNKLFCGVIALTTVFQVIIVEFLKNFFKTTRLSWKYWILCIVIGAIGLLVGVVSKLIPVPEKPFFTRTRKHRPRRRGSLSEHRGSLSEHKGDKEKIYLGPPQERPLNGDACDNV